MWKRLPPLAPISSPNVDFPWEPLEVRNQRGFNFFFFCPFSCFPTSVPRPAALEHGKHTQARILSLGGTYLPSRQTFK